MLPLAPGGRRLREGELYAQCSLGEGDWTSAERRLAEAHAGIREPRGTLHLAWLDEGPALARAALLRVPEWALLVARAVALASASRATEAIEAVRATEDVLDAATPLVPLGEGRGAFASGRSRSARSLVGRLDTSLRLRSGLIATCALGRWLRLREVVGIVR